MELDDRKVKILKTIIKSYMENRFAHVLLLKYLTGSLVVQLLEMR